MESSHFPHSAMGHCENPALMMLNHASRRLSHRCGPANMLVGRIKLVFDSLLRQLWRVGDTG